MIQYGLTAWSVLYLTTTRSKRCKADFGAGSSSGIATARTRKGCEHPAPVLVNWGWVRNLNSSCRERVLISQLVIFMS